MEEMRKQVLQMQEEAKRISMLQSQVVEQMHKPKGVALDAERARKGRPVVEAERVRLPVQVEIFLLDSRADRCPSIAVFPRLGFAPNSKLRGPTPIIS